MVRAILARQKTQTRRLVTDKHLRKFGLDARAYKSLDSSPYGGVGNRIWVKETWAVSKLLDRVKPRELPAGLPIAYRAEDYQNQIADVGKWRTPLFMCEALSRITLVIDGVRIERLNDCTTMDAQAEGVGGQEHSESEDFIALYKNSWEVIHGSKSWELNPFVWVITFKWVNKK